MSHRSIGGPVERFSGRAEAYERYRPGYPATLIEYIIHETGLDARHTVADIGSGTGLLSRLFLDTGCTVIGVEPNDAMRRAAEQALAGRENFRSVSGRAEKSGLPAQSVDYVAAGQAAHWFDLVRSRVEFRRILKTDGWMLFVWNNRPVDQDPLLQAYEALLKQLIPEYGQVRTNNMETGVADWFAPAPVHEVRFPNPQQYDFEMFRGRALSSSYAPLPDNPLYEPFVSALSQLFDRFQQNGRLGFSYETRLYYGQIR